MKKLLTLLLLSLLISCGTRNQSIPFEPDWDSLGKHEAAPEWFRDAKLGIYFHWGIYSVPAFGNEWYPRWMHFEGRPEYIHHLETYGKPSEFAYHDFVPMFTAENFDAEEWAELFEKAGAKFAGPVAEHHDGFSMWHSSITPWNAYDKGPKRDITGELAGAIRAHNMKFITTFHHAKNLQRFDSINMDARGYGFKNSHYPFIKGMPPSSDDDTLRYLYGNIEAETWLKEVWLGKLKEVIDLYHPDIMWFDSWLDQIPENYRKEFCAYYLNEAQKRNEEVVIVRKQMDLPLEFTVDDLEKARKNVLGAEPWMTDETISKGSWCYTSDLQIKPFRDILHEFVDIVSKNGILLLNISPMANGTIPEDQKDLLLQLGDWLKKNGETIYGTRPWYTFGEGPTKEPEGHFKNREVFMNLKYSWKDVRYTTKGNTVNALLLGSPEQDTSILLKAFASDSLDQTVKILSVTRMNTNDPVTWKLLDSGLSIDVSASANEDVLLYQIETKDLL